MRATLGFILVIGMAIAAPYFSPWWGIAVLAGLVGLLVGAKWWQSLFYGFLGAATVWVVQTYMLNTSNQGILAGQMATLFKMEGAMTMVYITGLLGALLGGLGALSGSLLRAGFAPVQKKRRSPNVSRRRKRRRRR